MALRPEAPRSEQSIAARNMRQNQVARIASWGDCREYVGLIVKRCGEAVFSLTSVDWWERLPAGDNYRVVPLPNGFVFTVVSNE